jgi:hypothetical protein
MKLKSLFSFLALFSVALPVSGGDNLLDAYTEVSTALAADDLEATQKAAAELAAIVKGEHPDIAGDAEAVARSNSLETARDKLRPLSGDAVKLAQDKEGYYVMTCPMAKGDWVQKDKEVANPYYGASMLRCGGLKTR